MGFTPFTYLGIVQSVLLPQILVWASMNDSYEEPYSRSDADVVLVSTDNKKFRAHSYRLRANR